MLCCAFLLTLLAAPVIVFGRHLGRNGANPLAWRLGRTDERLATWEGPAQRLRRLIRNRARSFVFAGAGIRHVVRSEPASLIHMAAAIVALGSSFLLDLSAQDWRWIVFVVLLVWSAEAFNTAIESTCNLLSPAFSEHVRIAKDVSAGAVLLVSIGAVIIGLLTFWPYVAARLLSVNTLPELASILCRAVL